jgi:hypothetical protein
VPRHQAAIINVYAPDVSAPHSRRTCNRQRWTPTLALSPSTESDALGRPTPARRLAQAVAALPEALVGLPFGTPPLGPALASCARPVRLMRPRATVLPDKKPRPFSRIEPDSSRPILAARQENPEPPPKSTGWNIYKIATPAVSLVERSTLSYCPQAARPWHVSFSNGVGDLVQHHR